MQHSTPHSTPRTHGGGACGGAQLCAYVASCRPHRLEEQLPRVQLHEDAARAPHVGGRAPPQAQDDLGGAVLARVDEGALVLPVKGGAPKVNQLQGGGGGGEHALPRPPHARGLAGGREGLPAHQQHVLQLQVRVDEAHAVQEGHGLQQLVSEGLHAVQRRGPVLVRLHVVVQRGPQRLEHHAEVPAHLEGVQVAHAERGAAGVGRVHVAQDVSLDAGSLAVLAHPPHDLDRNEGPRRAAAVVGGGARQRAPAAAAATAAAVSVAMSTAGRASSSQVLTQQHFTEGALA